MKNRFRKHAIGGHINSAGLCDFVETDRKLTRGKPTCRWAREMKSCRRCKQFTFGEVGVFRDDGREGSKEIFASALQRRRSEADVAEQRIHTPSFTATLMDEGQM